MELQSSIKNGFAAQDFPNTQSVRGYTSTVFLYVTDVEVWPARHAAGRLGVEEEPRFRAVVSLRFFGEAQSYRWGQNPPPKPPYRPLFKSKRCQEAGDGLGVPLFQGPSNVRGEWQTTEPRRQTILTLSVR